MAVTVAALRARYPEFTEAVYRDASVNAAIDTAYDLANLSDRHTLACAAHLLALSLDESGEADGGAGEVKSETIGPKMVGYQVQAMDAREAFFTVTPYGRLVLQIEARDPRVALSAFSA